MLIGVMLHGFFRVPDGVHRVTVGDVRVMAGCNMIAVIVVARCFAVMFGRVVMMLGGFQMVLNALVFRHVVLSLIADVTCRPLRSREESVKGW